MLQNCASECVNNRSYPALQQTCDKGSPCSLGHDSGALISSLLIYRGSTAVLSKIPHSNCCRRVPNRPLRGRRGRFGTLLQLLECGIFGRTGVPTNREQARTSCENGLACAHAQGALHLASSLQRGWRSRAVFGTRCGRCAEWWRAERARYPSSAAWPVNHRGGETMHPNRAPAVVRETIGNSTGVWLTWWVAAVQSPPL